jgi:hypothetical protein
LVFIPVWVAVGVNYAVDLILGDRPDIIEGRNMPRPIGIIFLHAINQLIPYSQIWPTDTLPTKLSGTFVQYKIKVDL